MWSLHTLIIFTYCYHPGNQYISPWHVYFCAGNIPGSAGSFQAHGEQENQQWVDYQYLQHWSKGTHAWFYGLSNPLINQQLVDYFQHWRAWFYGLSKVISPCNNTYTCTWCSYVLHANNVSADFSCWTSNNLTTIWHILTKPVLCRLDGRSVSKLWSH